MSDRSYEKLARAMDALPNGFPRTEEGWEIAILKRIASPEEADLASGLSVEWEQAEVIAERSGLPFRGVRRMLMRMARKGLVWIDRGEKGFTYRLAAFVVGLYEAQVESMDAELAHLFEHYLAAGGAAGIMKPQPALQRVVPARGAVKSEWILPYDDVRAILLAAKHYRVQDCICRKQQDLVGARKCDFPLEVCVSFTTDERDPRPDDIPRERALAILDECEEVGLVHSVSNVQRGVFYVCNCCGCCCGILRGITEWGIQESVARANYTAVIDSDACVGCGTCRERCQVGAIEEEDGTMRVAVERCIGCGVCVTGCPNDAVELERREDARIVPPPEDFAAWERLRLENRGLA